MNNDGKNRYFRGESSFTGENADREWPENYRRGLESSREYVRTRKGFLLLLLFYAVKNI